MAPPLSEQKHIPPALPLPPDNRAVVVVIADDHFESQDDKKEEQEMVNATNAVKTAAIGGRTAVSRLIYDAVALLIASKD